MSATTQQQTTVTVVDMNACVARFENTFKLEGELVGSTRRRTSAKGAVRLELLPLKTGDGSPSLTSASGKTGDELALWKRTQQDKLKSEMCALVSRMGTSPEWTGRNLTMNAKGNRITLAFDKVDAVTVTKETPESLKVKAEALGYTLVPAPKPAELNPAGNGGATVAKPQPK